ncbi:MAG: OsmC family peroxiredoxin [Pedobacter sp.]|nr:MAG: OsmC family peroxiredoxin [Pedobacter sp.]
MPTPTITAITELDKSHYKTKIYAGGHFIYSDEPERIGGTDEGMTPGALLLASLGSCTAITIRMYADRKEIPLDTIKIELEICSEENMSAQTTIKRKITFTGDLSSDQHDRLMEIADKCPIHKILSNPIKIETSS